MGCKAESIRSLSLVKRGTSGGTYSISISNFIDVNPYESLGAPNKFNKSEVIAFGVASYKSAACHESGSRFFLLPICICHKEGSFPSFSPTITPSRTTMLAIGGGYRGCCNCFRNSICIQSQRVPCACPKAPLIVHLLYYDGDSRIQDS